MHKIKRAAEIAKTRTNNKRWIAAIDKAVAGVESGNWIITELAHGIAVTTESGETYFVSGACRCKAFANGQPCKHRALARLIEIAREIEETAPVAVAAAPKSYCGDRDLQHLTNCLPHIVRAIEGDPRTGAPVLAVRCNGWLI